MEKRWYHRARGNEGLRNMAEEEWTFQQTKRQGGAFSRAGIAEKSPGVDCTPGGLPMRGSSPREKVGKDG